MTLKNFRASDFRKGENTVKAVKSKRDVVRETDPVPTTKPVVTGDPEDVPSGTVPEIMTWVGDDLKRAQKALDKEVEDEKPRKGLVSQLQEIVDSADDSVDEDSTEEEEEEDN